MVIGIPNFHESGWEGNPEISKELEIPLENAQFGIHQVQNLVISVLTDSLDNCVTKVVLIT